MSVAVPTILLPILDEATLDHLLPFALTLGQARTSTIVVLELVTIEADQPFSAAVVTARQRREALQQRILRFGSAVRASVRVARSAYIGITDAVRDEAAALLIVGWQDTLLSPERLFGPPLEQLVATPPCDLLIIRQSLHGMPRRILLPTLGGPNLDLSAEVALALAKESDGSVTVLLATDPQRPNDPVTTNNIRRFQGMPRVKYLLEPAPQVLPVVIDEASKFDAIVVGTTGRRVGQSAVGPFGEQVLKQANTTVILACHKLAETEQHAVERFEAQRDIANRVDHWFAENTFSAEEFAEVQDLIRLKQQQDLRISLVLPALNEAATIGGIIDVLKDQLVDQARLLDEIVLMDSNSSDETRAIAEARGIRVCIHQEILPSYGAFAGKGEALWKSLFVTSGDIVVWLDTDVTNMHPRFVYGLVGPLLREPRLQFSKGFYRRPINEQGQLLEAGGGRVTELVTRPLFNLFYPELSGFIQPLSGEYAARRSALEHLPFFTGYGVETGLLIDLLHSVGLSGMAQVDLQQRIHRNQELDGLSRMSFAIIQVIMQRLETRQRLHLIDPLNQSLNLIKYAAEGGFYLDVRHIRDHERPPIATIPEYRERFNLRSTVLSE